MRKISVIVPVYNAKETLERCVESVLRQEVPELELVLVEDGSSDGSDALCDRLAAGEERIRVFHKENGGVSSARNLGIREATGKYVCFVDSDDRLREGALDKLLAEAELGNADLVMCGFTYYVEKTGEMVDSCPKERFCGGGSRYLAERFGEDFARELLNPPWNKLIRRRILTEQAICFPEDYAICEDMAFSIQVLAACERICVIPRALYLYDYKEADNLVNRFHPNYYEALSYFRDCVERYFAKLGAKAELRTRMDAYFVGKSLMFLHKIYRQSGYAETVKKEELRRIGSSENLREAWRGYPVRGDLKMRLLRELFLRQHFGILDRLYRVSAGRGGACGNL